MMYLLLALSIMGCKNQKDLIEIIELTYFDNNTLYYELYKTGIDNYKYKFKVCTIHDTLDVFDVYVNDASYKYIKISVQEKEDTIFINSNWGLGDYSKPVKNKLIILKSD